MFLDRNRSPFFLCFVAAMALFFTPRAFPYSQEGGDPDYLESQAEIEIRTAALKSAYREAELRGFESRDKIVVIQKRKSLVVVSFINKAPRFGGQSHYVFDPKAAKIIRVDFED